MSATTSYAKTASVQSSTRRALLTYRYPQYDAGTANLGDFIQSLAARQFYPRVDCLLDRDAIAQISNPIKAIVNGWYRLDDEYHYSEFLHPKALSIHISNPKDFEKQAKTLEHWSEFGPIGCRDEKTADFIRSHGFKAYFSGCLTTTLGCSFKNKRSVNSGEGVKVVFADLNPNLVCNEDLSSLNIFQKVRHSVLNGIVNRKLASIVNELIPANAEIQVTQHLAPLGLSDDEYFKQAEALLRIYEQADLVLTSRIHCALPCLGMGTPVVLFANDASDLRFPGLIDWLNTVRYTRKGNIRTSIQTENGSVVNPKKHVEYATRMADECERFFAKD